MSIHVKVTHVCSYFVQNVVAIVVLGHLTAEDAYSNCVTIAPSPLAPPHPLPTNMTVSHCHRSTPNFDDNRNGSACFWHLIYVFLLFSFTSTDRWTQSVVRIVPNQHQFNSILPNGHHSDLAALADTKFIWQLSTNFTKIVLIKAFVYSLLKKLINGNILFVATLYVTLYVRKAGIFDPIKYIYS